MDAEQLTDNRAGHLVIASLELTCLDFQAQSADTLLADIGNLVEVHGKLPDGRLVGGQMDRVVWLASARRRRGLRRCGLGIMDAVCSRIL